MTLRFILRTVLTAGISLLVMGSVAAQPREPNFGQGTHALRAILRQKFGMRPTVYDPMPDQTDVLVVVLGRLDPLHDWGGRKLRNFVEAGGSVLIASDQASVRGQDDPLDEAFRIKITGDFLRVPTSSPHAYRLPDCPVVTDLTWEQPIFRTIRQLATNRPSHLVVRTNSPLSGLAWFPEDTRWEGRGKARIQARQFTFAAGGRLRAGRALVLADHSVFINDMILQRDNDNFFFACNCIAWLTEGGSKTRVYFVEDGQVNTNFNVSFRDSPNLPMPSEGQIIDKGNEILAGLEEEDFFNRLLNKIPPEVLHRLALLLATVVLGVYCLWRLSKSRNRVEPQEPIFGPTLERSLPAGTLTERRQQAMRRDDNYRELAQGLARQCFLTAPGAPRPAGLDVFERQPAVAVQAGWWRRRGLRGKVLSLWQLAAGKAPERISARRLQRVYADARQVQASLADGTIRLD